MIDNFNAVFSQFSFSQLMSAHIVPDILNVIVMGGVWILFAFYLYYYKEDLRLSVLIVIGLFICSVLCNEILRPILFHFRFTLEQSGIRMYLPEIANHRFPAGYLMMAASSIVLINFSEHSLGKYALGLGIFIAVVNLRVLFSYTLDFFYGIALGVIIGRLLINFYIKKEEEEEEFEEFEERFHF